MTQPRFIQLNRGRSGGVLPLVDASRLVPKVICQTYPTKNLPPEIKDNISKLTTLNPEWRHLLFDDAEIERFIDEEYPIEVFRLYRKLNPKYGAARADLFRYLFLYKHGGVYLDIKSTANRRLDDIVPTDGTFFISQSKNGSGEKYENKGIHHDLAGIPGGEYQQWYIIAPPGHPYLRAVIETIFRNIKIYIHSIHGDGLFGVIRVTGPVAYTLALQPILKYGKYRFVSSELDLGIYHSIFDISEGRETKAHMKLFAAHYSQLTEPIVFQSRVNSGLSSLYRSLKPVYDWVKSRRFR